MKTSRIKARAVFSFLAITIIIIIIPIIIFVRILLSKCKMAGLFSCCSSRISLLVLSGNERSCMFPINMFLLVGHGHIVFCGIVQR